MSKLQNVTFIESVKAPVNEYFYSDDKYDLNLDDASWIVSIKHLRNHEFPLVEVPFSNVKQFTRKESVVVKKK